MENYSENTIEEMLMRFKDGGLSMEEIMLKLKMEPYVDLDFAKLDTHRRIRQGAAEVIYGAGKTKEQLLVIVEKLIEAGQKTVLITRISREAYLYLKDKLTACVSGDEALHAFYEKLSGTCVIGDFPTPSGHGTIAVVTGGTSDMPVAEEAALTAEALGNKVERIYDVGVAGIHRLFAHLDTLMRASVVIAIAGMEGALASVVGGLVSCPVIAVPTSVGYGANFGGLSALLSMLNSCASGVSVVNIDNGFGAGYQASMINHV
ncbi:MAG: nickel pincer cofactor biosynthesis protein LarB [Clostridium sp.]|nr:nickel pincer cofactor biosynthesis protein LarB [Clostridium sp.]